MKYVVLASGDFEEMVEKVIKIPADATMRHRRALAEALAKGFAQGGPAPSDSGASEEVSVLRV